MKAVVILDRDGRRDLAVMDLPRPEPGPTQILVRVRGAGLNRADLARGVVHYDHSGPVPEHPTAGLEMAGEVVACGGAVTRYAGGERVMAMAQRSFAEFVALDERLAVPVPAALDWVEAAAIPVVYMTAHDALTTRAMLRPGESVLVHAVSGGVGTAALQIARVKGARPILGTTGSTAKAVRLAAEGLDAAIDYRDGFAAGVLERTGGRGVDVIIDTVGASALADNLRAAALRGRIVDVGRMGGPIASIDLELFARKRLTLVGVTFRTRTLDEHAEIVRHFADDLLPSFASGAIKPLIHGTFPLVEAEAAQAALKAGSHLGKIVLTMD